MGGMPLIASSISHDARAAADIGASPSLRFTQKQVSLSTMLGAEDGSATAGAGEPLRCGAPEAGAGAEMTPRTRSGPRQAWRTSS